MPTQSFFRRYPPFPGNLPTLPMPRLSYDKLLKNDLSESSSLWEAVTSHGFFLMDFSGSPGGAELIDDVVRAFDASRKFFDQPAAEKEKIPLGKGNVGYKPMGMIKSKDGEPDLVELCNVTKDDLMGGTDAIPAAFRADTPLLASTAQRLHDVTLTILTHLAQHLDLPADAFNDYHDPSRPSVSVLRFLHYAPQPAGGAQRTSLMGHTDNGVLTVLFTAMGGLQVLPWGRADEPGAWAWVRPEPGCAIVNVGDCLVQWTGGVLHSAFHRVLHAPGAQAAHTRLSLGYFLKPAQDAPMRRVCGGRVPALTPEEQLVDAEIGTYATFHSAKNQGLSKGENKVFGGDRGVAPATPGVKAA